MHKIHHSAANDAWDQPAGDDVTKPLTREEAQALKQQNPAISPWMVLAGQAAGGVLSALAAWWVSGKSTVGWSVMYGAMAVVIPGALFARGLMSKVSLINPAAAVTGFFFVGNGEDRSGAGDVVCRTEAGHEFELARHVGGAGGDNEGGLVGALA